MAQFFPYLIRRYNVKIVGKTEFTNKGLFKLYRFVYSVFQQEIKTKFSYICKIVVKNNFVTVEYFKILKVVDFVRLFRVVNSLAFQNHTTVD